MTAEEARRFPMRLDTWWLPVLALAGVTRSRAYLTVDLATITLRFGFFRHVLPRGQIVNARRVHGFWGYGIGWHADFAGGVAINGSLAGMVEIEFAPPTRVHLAGIPVRCRTLWTSLQDPDAFLQALGFPASPLR